MIGMSCLLLGVGGVLFVCRDGADLPVPYFSRQTKLHEEKYSATELDAQSLLSLSNTSGCILLEPTCSYINQQYYYNDHYEVELSYLHS